MKEIRRTDDFFIRYLFGDNSNTDILLDFVNSVMKDSNFETFKSVTILNPFNLKQNFTDKESILDVKATTNSGESVIIEVQIAGNRSFIQRSLYYIAKTYTSLIGEGFNYSKLKPVISINILNFSIDENLKPHTCYLLIEKDLGQLLTNDIEIHFLELPKHMNNDSEKNIIKDLSVWAEFFTTDNLEGVMTKLINDKPIMEKVIKKYNHFTMDKDLITEYDRHITYKLGYNLTMEEERRLGREEGIEKGIEKGKELGVVEGIEKGIVEGKIEIAKSMKKKNMAVSDIVELTGLSEVEINNL